MKRCSIDKHAVGKNQSSAPLFDPSETEIPRSARRRGSSSRGLPKGDDLRTLAEVYLKSQRQLWPELVSAKLLPEFTEDVIAKAEKTMDKWIAAATNVLAEYKLGELVTLNKSQFKLAAVESGGEDGSDGMLQRVRAKAASGEGHGIEILDIGIRKLGVPDNVSKAVFERMKQNRTAEARRLVTQGQGEADMIVGTAEAEARGIMARANAEARKIQGEGDAAAAEYYTTFLDNPTLSNFLRRLQTLRETLSERTTIILDSGTPPYQLLTAEPTIGGAGTGQ